MVQWVGLCASAAGRGGVIPGQGAKILHAIGPKKHTKKQNKQTKNTPKDRAVGSSCELL